MDLTRGYIQGDFKAKTHIGETRCDPLHRSSFGVMEPHERIRAWKPKLKRKHELIIVDEKEF
jgi:hypothetical protein